MPNVMEQSCNGCVRSKTRPEANPVSALGMMNCVCVCAQRKAQNLRKAQTLMSKSLFKIVRNQNCHKWITYILKSNIGMVMVIQTAMGIPIDNGRKNTCQWIDECPEDRQFAQVMTEFSVARVATHHVIPCRRGYMGLGQSWTSKNQSIIHFQAERLGTNTVVPCRASGRDLLPAKHVPVERLPPRCSRRHHALARSLRPSICQASAMDCMVPLIQKSRDGEPSLLLKSWKIRSTEVLADALNLRNEHLQMEQEGRRLISSF